MLKRKLENEILICTSYTFVTYAWANKLSARLPKWKFKNHLGWCLPFDYHVRITGTQIKGFPHRTSNNPTLSASYIDLSVRASEQLTSDSPAIQ
ncbi:hypothetical protein Plhal710r2_c006g0028681 [Plasmopara halstedii]